MEFIDRIRNFITLACLYLLSTLLVIYLCGALFTVSVWGFNYLKFGFQDVLNLYVYLKWYAQNYALLPWDANNYLVIKILACAGGIPLIIALFLYKFRSHIFAWRPFKKKESIHGDAKWANEEDIKKAGLRQKEGMLLGQDSTGYYISGGYQHALLFAPTGSGKGVGFVIPNLLYWHESVIVHDIKLENYELTSGWRAKLGQQVFVWEPANPDGFTHCYNPIDWVSPKPGQMVDDVQKIANLILPKKDFWENEARTLFVGIVLYLLAVPDKTKSFGEVVRTLRSDDCVYNLAVVLDTIGKYIHPVAYMNIAAFLQKADKERSGVISTLNSGLELWANPLIDAATARSDFNIMMFKKIKTTIYVGLTPDNIKRLEPLMKVFYQQASEFLSRKIPKKEDEPYGVLFMMDEFPTLGKMEQFKTGIAYFRGYNVRLFLIIQDTEQLRDIYEEAGMNSFLSNSTYRITFSANNYQTAELISKLCGNKTVEQTSMNKPKFLDFNPASRSMHVSQTQRALLLPQEVINLPRDDQIVLIESFPPIKSKKIRYYDDKFFTKRLLPPIVIPQQEPYDPNKFRSTATKKEDGKSEENNISNNLLEDAESPADTVQTTQPDLPQNDDDFKFDFELDDELTPEDNKDLIKQLRSNPTAKLAEEENDDDDFDFNFDLDDEEEDQQFLAQNPAYQSQTHDNTSGEEEELEHENTNNLAKQLQSNPAAKHAEEENDDDDFDFNFDLDDEEEEQQHAAQNPAYQSQTHDNTSGEEAELEHENANNLAKQLQSNPAAKHAEEESDDNDSDFNFDLDDEDEEQQHAAQNPAYQSQTHDNTSGEEAELEHENANNLAKQLQSNPAAKHAEEESDDNDSDFNFDLDDEEEEQQLVTQNPAYHSQTHDNTSDEEEGNNTEEASSDENSSTGETTTTQLETEAATSKPSVVSSHQEELPSYHEQSNAALLAPKSEHNLIHNILSSQTPIIQPNIPTSKTKKVDESDSTSSTPSSPNSVNTGSLNTALPEEVSSKRKYVEPIAAASQVADTQPTLEDRQHPTTQQEEIELIPLPTKNETLASENNTKTDLAAGKETSKNAHIYPEFKDIVIGAEEPTEEDDFNSNQADSDDNDSSDIPKPK
ncbi:type IV secretory system conjugative DNA transfer family protein [Rickettsiales endosymbiont of Stachyamoeba lipophora]|uniref:type IV secretory system conjugative DNA transfer family protein n=1 Tax=Rickettsiales endosymbiont of Stachyamoeba lipophora TaxID=2486578 RepID=UPI000F6548AB|nr:hypothetical protein EF513_03790 [Rickettsiales endosymbiont of Stachyamoeba lipophora]